MANFNFKTSDKELIESGINFSNPTVLAVEPTKNRNGYNVMFVQEIKNLPSAGTTTNINPILTAAKQKGWEISGQESKIFARAFKYYAEGKQPKAGQIFKELELICYDTINLSELEGICITDSLKPRQNKSGQIYTNNGEEIFRTYLIMDKGQYEHTVLKYDKIEEIKKSSMINKLKSVTTDKVAF